jgi:hypothetical protein
MPGQICQQVGRDIVEVAGVPGQLQTIIQMLQQQQQMLQQQQQMLQQQQQTLQQQQQTLQQMQKDIATIQVDLVDLRREELARQWTTARVFNTAAGLQQPLMALDFPPGMPAPLPPFPATRAAVDALTSAQVSSLVPPRPMLLLLWPHATLPHLCMPTDLVPQVATLLAAYAKPPVAQVVARRKALKEFIGAV